jgi:hypothetical protein
MNHNHTQIHKTRHNLDFVIIVFFVISHGATPKCHFSQDSQAKTPKIPKIGTFVILEAHNFLYKPLIKARSKAKL